MLGPSKRRRRTTPKKDAATIVFEGRLLELPSEAPRCGDMQVAVAYRFRVEKPVKGKVGRGPLVVLIPCPDLKGERFFTVSARYRIEATADLAEARVYTIYNDYVRRPLLWCVRITSVGPARRTKGA